ncbi:hypothetical protein F8388_023852 [Cannabis sativa]|uniref:Uncharacterized protein n=1 Tax=Cannabis sativa TaxID=3483 RepID=A0A7J6GA60_CANSA|nr:hypothetical protein F8388_023852 [Cannabis sativa]
MEFKSSRLVVPSVQELLAKDPNMVTIPSRYIQNPQNNINNSVSLDHQIPKKLCQLPGDIEGFGQTQVFSEEQKLDWTDYILIFTLPLAVRKPHLFPNLPITLKQNSVIAPANTLITPKNPALYKTLSNKEYFKDFFSSELQGKSYLDSMKL